MTAPKAYDDFDGEVGRVFSTSEPSWPAPPTAPEGAPNVIVMLADDLGFADLGCYGAEISTPHLDRLASEGLRYSNFHVNPMCSPTRASMLTGLNHHMAGVGHVAHFDPGFPGYAMEIRDDAVTMAELFRDNGWASLMVGKWHLCKDSHLSEAGPRHSWPLQKGFERYYGILDGFTNFHQPHRLYADNHALDVDEFDDDYYFTDDLTDQAISMIKEVRTAHPRKPWFMYFSHGAVHAPLQAKADDIERYRGRYDEGWDEIRRQRFERQKELGVISDHAELPPRNHEPLHAVEAWDDLDDMERELFARYQEIFAGMVDNLDQNFGRLRAELEAIGEWENTIVVFTSDNGGSREGQDLGTSAYFRTLLANAAPTGLDQVVIDHARMDLLGGPQSLVHYPMGWAMVSSTPFRLYKINTHQGGQQVPFIVRLPAGMAADDPGAVRTQYQHITDLLPTLAELTGVEIPTEKSGKPVPSPAGAAMTASLADGSAASSHPEQYYEMIGHRGFYRDGWSAVTCHQPRTSFSDEQWELHDLTRDPTEIVDLAEAEPEKLAELVDAWEEAAWANQVYPLDEGNAVKAMLRPPWEVELVEPVTVYPGTPTLERWRSLQLINFRAFDVVVSLTWAPGDGGTLVAHGDQGGGYALLVEDDRLLFVHNGYGDMTEIDGGPMVSGDGEIGLSVTPASGDRLRWNASLTVNGDVRATTEDLLVLTAMAPFQGIDVGIDRRSPVSWRHYEMHRTNPWRGQLHRVRYEPGELAEFAPEKWLDVLKASGTKYE